jgi:hypothetical protein
MPDGPKRSPFAAASMWAAALVLFELAANQGFVSRFVLVFVTPFLLIRALLAWKKRPLMIERLTAMMIIGCAAWLSGLFVKATGKAAQERASQIIAACEEYNRLNHHYPAALDELVPKFLPAIPPAKRTFVNEGRFTYLSVTGGSSAASGSASNLHILEYVAIPPYGKASYILEQKRWRLRD